MSRRLLNASYVCWQLWLNLLLLGLFQLLELVHRSLLPAAAAAPLMSSVDAAIARHALLFFLLSNLCTGAVNLLVRTLTADDATAVVMLLLYLHLVVLAVTGYHWLRQPAKHSPPR